MDERLRTGEIVYPEIAVELGGGIALEELDPLVVEDAKLYAESAGLPWPPHPVGPEWDVTAYSIREE